jgi:hypothetical protein
MTQSISWLKTDCIAARMKAALLQQGIITVMVGCGSA